MSIIAKLSENYLCNNTVSDSGTGIFTYAIIINEGVGVGLFSYNCYNIPNRFVVNIDGQDVLDTGYVGDASYNKDLQALGLGSVVGGGAGRASYTKNTDNRYAFITVYAPLEEDNKWDFSINCFQEMLPTPTPTPVTPTPTPTNEIDCRFPPPSHTPTPTDILTVLPAIDIDCSTGVIQHTLGGLYTYRINHSPFTSDNIRIEFNTYNIPDQFTLYYLGQYTTTGYAGDSIYNSALNKLNLPNVQSPSQGVIEYEATAGERALLYIEAPLSNTVFTFNVVCPTPTPSNSATPKPTTSNTNTPNPTASPTKTKTPTKTSTCTKTNTKTPTPTRTASITPTPSITSSHTQTPSITMSPTPTETKLPKIGDDYILVDIAWQSQFPCKKAYGPGAWWWVNDPEWYNCHQLYNGILDNTEAYFELRVYIINTYAEETNANINGPIPRMEPAAINYFRSLGRDGFDRGFGGVTSPYYYRTLPNVISQSLWSKDNIQPQGSFWRDSRLPAIKDCWKDFIYEPFEVHFGYLCRIANAKGLDCKYDLESVRLNITDLQRYINLLDPATVKYKDSVRLKGVLKYVSISSEAKVCDSMVGITMTDLCVGEVPTDKEALIDCEGLMKSPAVSNIWLTRTVKPNLNNPYYSIQASKKFKKIIDKKVSTISQANGPDWQVGCTGASCKYEVQQERLEPLFDVTINFSDFDAFYP